MRRDCRGNMLVLVAITALLLVSLLVFVLSVLSVNRGHMEQRTAAEGAALAAASDIGQIVINSPEFGFVSLCDMPPTGVSTKAPDNFFCEVRSINELMAAARLHLLIANAVGDEFMKQLAYDERTRVLKVKDELVKAIQASLKKGGRAKDINGQDITPYKDAEAVYKKNTAKQSAYVPGSLKLTLGCLEDGIATQVNVPQPTSKAYVNSKQSIGGCYVSDTDIAVDEVSYVFASTGKRVALDDPARFKTSIPGLNNPIPAVVKVEADQEFEDQGRTYKQKFVACATTGSDVVRPAGGALCVSFPDGPVPDVQTVQQLFTWREMTKNNAEILTAENGDFPVDNGARLTENYRWPTPNWPSKTPTAADAAKLGIYDWLACGGSKVNIDSLNKMMSANFNPPDTATVPWIANDPLTKADVNIGMVPAGVMHIYTFTDTGNIAYRSKRCKPYPYTSMADAQLYAETDPEDPLRSNTLAEWELEATFNLPGGRPNRRGGGVQTVGRTSVDITGRKYYDFCMRDQVHQRGLMYGGKHNGETMDSDAVANQLAPTRLSPLRLAMASSPSQYEVGGIYVSQGGGAPPIVSRQDDFATSTLPAPPYTKYKSGPATGAPRGTYTQNGLAVEIRFRRQIDVGELKVLLGGYDTGYIGEMLDP